MSTVLGLPVVLIDRGSTRPPDPHRSYAEGGRVEGKRPPNPPRPVHRTHTGCTWQVDGAKRSDGIPGSPVLGCWHGLLKHGLAGRSRIGIAVPVAVGSSRRLRAHRRVPALVRDDSASFRDLSAT